MAFRLTDTGALGGAGHGAAGALLPEEDFDVEPVELIPRSDGVEEPVSSTAIRRALAPQSAPVWRIMGKIRWHSAGSSLLSLRLVVVVGQLSIDGACISDDSMASHWPHAPDNRKSRT